MNTHEEWAAEFRRIADWIEKEKPTSAAIVRAIGKLILDLGQALVKAEI